MLDEDFATGLASGFWEDQNYFRDRTKAALAELSAKKAAGQHRKAGYLDLARLIDAHLEERISKASKRGYEALIGMDQDTVGSPLELDATDQDFARYRGEVQVLIDSAVLARVAVDKSIFFVGAERKSLRMLLESLIALRNGAYAAADAIDTQQADDEAALREQIDSWARVLVARERERAETFKNYVLPAYGAVAAPFADSLWHEWAPAESPREVFWGWFGAERGESPEIPANIGFPYVRSLRRMSPVVQLFGQAHREKAVSAARALVLRLLAAYPPGQLVLTIVDPLGLGETLAPLLALGDHSQDLLSGKVRSSQSEVEEQLRELSRHVEHVITKYLRGDFENIDDYNNAAGEVAEKYRLLLVFDFPAQFTESMQFELKRLMDVGPRCGVHTVVFANTDASSAYGVNHAVLPGTRMVINEAVAEEIYWVSEADPASVLGQEAGQQLIDRIIDRVGRDSNKPEAPVDLARVSRLFAETIKAGIRPDIPSDTVPAEMGDPSTWWKSSTSEACVAPLGPSSAKDVALFRLDSSSMSGGFLIGRMGSGKSTLLHGIIAGLTTLYGPEELELYLIDFKEGVEFSAYAQQRLPHARCVAVESEREFGLSVLESIASEMQRRGALFRATGGKQTTFSSMRQGGGEHLTRIVLIFDEFHVLFAEEDRIGSRAAELLEQIIRQGRGFGIHVFLASQTMSGMSTFSRQKMDLLPVRVLLDSTQDDAALVLGEQNDGWKLIVKAGDGVLNNQGGAVEGNVPFRGAFEDDQSRLNRLGQLRQKAVRSGFNREPVVFEGFRPASLESTDAELFKNEYTGSAPWALPIRLGRAMTLAGSFDTKLNREDGANVLLIARDTDKMPLGIVSSMLHSVLVADATAEVDFVDFLSIDDGIETQLGALAASERVNMTRPRRLAEVLGSALALAKGRALADEFRAPARVIVLFGVNRARDLSPDSFFDEGEAPSIHEVLAQLLEIGPSVGVHLVVWADSLAGLSRRLSGSAIRGFGHIVAGKMSPDDSRALVDSDRASRLREHQVLHLAVDDARETRLMSYTVPPREWTEALFANALMR